MSRSRGKKDRLFRALQDLKSTRGNRFLMTSDVLGKLDESAKYDDYGVAIIYASHLERSLETAITTHFVTDPQRSARLFSSPETDGFLGNFAAKIAIAEALGVFDERMTRELLLIKNIRNAFAHASVRVTFETEAIKMTCAELKPDRTGVYFAEEWVELDTSRKRYTLTAAEINFYLQMENPNPLRFNESKFYTRLYR